MCLNSLGDQLQAKKLSEPDDGADDGRLTGVGSEVSYESGVHFQQVDRQRYHV